MSVTKRRRLLIAPVAIAVAVVAVWRSGAARDGGPGALEASGTVEATEAQLGFQAPGRIDTTLAREGDAVRAGAELGWLDRAEALARRAQGTAQVAAARAQLLELARGSRAEEIAQAEAALAAAAEHAADARRDLERTARLHEGGAASREQRDKATTALGVAESRRRQAAEALRLVRAGPRPERIAAARAQLAQAEAAVAAVDAQLANMTMRAPFDGVVTVRHREPGEIVPAGAPVLTVMNPGDRWVRIHVAEDRLAAVKLGMGAEIRSDTYAERRYPGEVAFVASEAEFTPKTVQTAEERVKLVYAVKVRITGDAGHDLKPGMPADVRLMAGSP